MESIIILIMWCACSLLIMIQYAPCCKEINEADKLSEGYDDSDLTSEQWQRLIELTKRANEIIY